MFNFRLLLPQITSEHLISQKKNLLTLIKGIAEEYEEHRFIIIFDGLVENQSFGT